MGLGGAGVGSKTWKHPIRNGKRLLLTKEGAFSVVGHKEMESVDGAEEAGKVSWK